LHPNHACCYRHDVPPLNYLPRDCHACPKQKRPEKLVAWGLRQAQGLKDCVPNPAAPAQITWACLVFSVIRLALSMTQVTSGDTGAYSRILVPLLDAAPIEQLGRTRAFGIHGRVRPDYPRPPIPRLPAHGSLGDTKGPFKIPTARSITAMLNLNAAKRTARKAFQPCGHPAGKSDTQAARWQTTRRQAMPVMVVKWTNPLSPLICQPPRLRGKDLQFESIL